MQNVPEPKYEVPNYSNYQPEQEQLRLRRRLNDLLKLGAATPETFQQAILQIFGEAERQRQQCMTAAEEHLRKYHQLYAQAAAFSMYSSIAYSVVNGYVTLEERRALEEMAKAKEKAEAEASTPGDIELEVPDDAAPSPLTSNSTPSPPMKGPGRRRKPVG